MCRVMPHHNSVSFAVPGTSTSHAAQPSGPRVSLCLVTRNEARFLPRMLATTHEYVDEIIVVDNGSTDDTVRIAERFGARVHRHAEATFQEARNRSIELASGEWILVIDPDERIHVEDLHVLRLLARTPVNAYRVWVNTYCGYGEWAAIPWIRFFQKAAGIRFSGSMHPGPGRSIRNCGGDIRDSGLVVHHLELAGPDVSLAKRRRNITNWERDTEAGLSSDPRVQVLHSLDLFALGRTEEAIAVCRAVLRTNPHFERTHRFLGDYLLATGDVGRAEAHYRSAIDCCAREPCDRACLAEVNFTGLARCAAARGAGQLAENYVDQALKVRRSTHGLLNKALLIERCRGYSAAEPLYRAALRRNPLLASPEIYSRGHAFNMYRQSSCILPCFRETDRNWTTFWCDLLDAEQGEGVLGGSHAGARPGRLDSGGGV
jgi:tetratricopeptide (TPR) repeat protein